MKNKAMIIILSAPSGGGKSSIAKKLLNHDSNLVLSISATTRFPRPSEIDGKDYFFKTKEDFSKIELLEYAEIYGNMYGTPKKYVEDQLSQGKDVLFDIDYQGAYQLMNTLDTKVVSIFIMPPNMEILKTRLESRNQDTKESIQHRLNAAKEEIMHAKNYNYIVVNDDFDKTVKEIEDIISLERRKAGKNESK